MSHVAVTGGDTITFGYNDNGVRILRDTNAAAKELFLVDANNLTGHAQVLEERTAAAAVVRAHLLGHDVLAQRDAANGVLHLVYDGHGSTRGALVDATGQLLNGEVYGYDAYGVRLDSHDPPTTLLYSGEWRDGAGFDYLRARPYEFANGRFLRMDDFAGSNQDPQSLHKYLYTHAEPVNGVDPTGLVSSLAEFFAVNTSGQNLQKVQSAENGRRTNATTARLLVTVTLLEMQRMAASIPSLDSPVGQAAA